jgi:type I restriction enzyme S subunit
VTITRLRHVVRINPPTPSFVHLPGDALVTFLPLEAVWPGTRLDLSQRREKRQVAAGYTRFQSGDVLVPKITPTFEAGRSVLVPSLETAVGAGTTELHVLRPGPKVERRFLTYVVNSALFLDRGEGEMYGVAGQKRVPDDFIRDFPIDLPEVEEQQRIANFLDAETARIDNLVSHKSQLLKLLDERVRALASLRCFRGLRPDAPTKESEIGPIGRVPEHWTVTRNKNIFREVIEPSLTGMEELLTVSHISGVTPRAEKNVNMFMAESLVGYKKCRPGDLVINTLWAWMGALGISRYHGIVSPAYGVYRLTGGSAASEYLDFLYRTPEYICEMTRYSKGVWTSRLRLYPESFLSLRVPLPPLSEQRSIVAAIRMELAPDLDLQRMLRESNALLEERRKALITAAVTGQFDVTTARGADLS